MVNRDENTHKVESSSVSVDLEETSLSEGDKETFKEFLDEFSDVEAWRFAINY